MLGLRLACPRRASDYVWWWDVSRRFPFIPAQAGIQLFGHKTGGSWVPAFAGTSGEIIFRARTSRLAVQTFVRPPDLARLAQLFGLHDRVVPILERAFGRGVDHVLDRLVI